MSKIVVLSVFSLEVIEHPLKLFIISADLDFIPSSGQVLLVKDGKWNIKGITLNTTAGKDFIKSPNKSYWHLMVSPMDEVSSNLEINPPVDGVIS
jgi:hypothetical protein